MLITVTLLAFLVLLLVSLASLTRVETQVAANSQALMQARQNALLALNVALGQLQKHAGADARVTARAEITSAMPVAAPYYTGVWNAGGVGAAADTWLVGGSEKTDATAEALLAAAPDPASDVVGADEVFVAGDRTVAADPEVPTAAEKARRVKLIKQDIVAPAGAVPGLAAGSEPVIGRYAWWVGDQGAKASLALPDRADEVVYAPWNTQTQRRRIRQQIGAAPNYFRAGNATTTRTKEGFDPIDLGAVMGNIRSDEQFALLTPAAGSMPAYARGHWHDFTATASAVQANTRTDAHAGLMRDLSLQPGELGTAFAAYADYPSYMEKPGTTLAGADEAFPKIEDSGTMKAADSPRRRYKIVAPASAPSAAGLPDLVFGVAPVLTDFMLQFKFERPSANKLSVRARFYVALWNPYTSALAPAATEGLALEVGGLPTLTVTDDVTGASTSFDLQDALPAIIKGADGDLRATLPFGGGATSRGTKADLASWLPGRVYCWATNTGSNPAGEMVFYEKNITAQGWAYDSVALQGSTNRLSVKTVGAIPGLKVRLRSSAGILANYTTPDFKGLSIPGTSSDGVTATPIWKFAFAVRMKQPVAGDTSRVWLKERDPRGNTQPSGFFGAFDTNQDITPLDPSVYMSATTPSTAYPDFLLYRVMAVASNGYSQGSYNDVPLFELPRMPLLSVGELQHLQVKDTRPFAIGNSWGGTANGVFDRFFFSGLPATVTADRGAPDMAAGQPLPNWNLVVADGSSFSTLKSAGAMSGRHLLQKGAFNVNSTSVAAWRAVLSSVRFANEFNPADIENSGGQAYGTQKSNTAVGAEYFNADATLGTGRAAPAFFRFPQSAQETYYWKTPGGGTGTQRLFATHAYRLGVRGSNDSAAASSTVDASVTAQKLTVDQVESLASAIVSLLRGRAAAKGPYRTLEEFLGPLSGVAGTDSLLEKAIADAGLNPDEVKPVDNTVKVGSYYGAGFSSLTLTQGDIMTALAPYLRARSDTFMIRTYGEALNPVTGNTLGKAWLEATVQRFPETVDSADNIDKPAGAFGRRFKIISFRWLSPSDI